MAQRGSIVLALPRTLSRGIREQSYIDAQDEQDGMDQRVSIASPAGAARC